VKEGKSEFSLIGGVCLAVFGSCAEISRFAALSLLACVLADRNRYFAGVCRVPRALMGERELWCFGEGDPKEGSCEIVGKWLEIALGVPSQ